MQEELAKKAEEERKRYREFTVTPGVNGFKVKIGCSEVYFGSAAELRNGIVSYLDNPQWAERDFLNRDIRRDGSIPTTAPPMQYQPNTIGGPEQAGIPIEGYIRQR